MRTRFVGFEDTRTAEAVRGQGVSYTENSDASQTPDLTNVGSTKLREDPSCGRDYPSHPRHVRQESRTAKDDWIVPHNHAGQKEEQVQTDVQPLPRPRFCQEVER